MLSTYQKNNKIPDSLKNWTNYHNERYEGKKHIGVK